MHGSPASALPDEADAVKPETPCRDVILRLAVNGARAFA
jgi:hypothetical protein